MILISKIANILKSTLVLRGLFDPQTTIAELKEKLYLSKWHETLYSGKHLLDLQKKKKKIRMIS